MSLIAAIKKDEALVNEMDSFIFDHQHFHLWWLGQSGYLLQWEKQRVLMDPYLSDSLTNKYAQTDKPHIRMSERVIDPRLLKNISIVTSSHNHTDHLDADTLVPVIQNNPGIQFIIPEANRKFVCDRLQCEIDFPTGLNAGQSVSTKGITIHGIPAKHNEIEKDENGNHKFMGYIFEFGRWKVYHSGDTIWFDEVVTHLKPYNVDVAILPINGNDSSRKVAGNLDATEAAELGKRINAKWVIPCHYDMFSFNTADVHEFEKQAMNRNQPYIILKGGEHFSL